MSDNKYIVFKRDEYEDFCKANELDIDWHVPLPIGDAVVLRLQDRFTAGALECYAHSVMAACELIEDFAMPSVVETKRLRQISDHFMDQAEASRHAQRKLPD